MGSPHFLQRPVVGLRQVPPCRMRESTGDRSKSSKWNGFTGVFFKNHQVLPRPPIYGWKAVGGADWLLLWRAADSPDLESLDPDHPHKDFVESVGGRRAAQGKRIDWTRSVAALSRVIARHVSATQSELDRTKPHILCSASCFPDLPLLDFHCELTEEHQLLSEARAIGQARLPRKAELPRYCATGPETRMVSTGTPACSR